MSVRKVSRRHTAGPLSSKAVALTVIGAAVIVVLVFVIRDFYLRPHAGVNCADGPHPVIDMRDFTTQYWTYSAKLEANIAGKAHASGEIDPKIVAQVSQSLQESNEFRKYVVAGYNSCAITPSEYRQLEAQFKTLENLAQRIDLVMLKPSLSQQDKTLLSALITQYGDLARRTNPR